MIRPEIRAAAWRWREVLAGATAILAGLWLWVFSAGLPTLFGLALILGGLVLAIPGLRRLRMRGDAMGAGVVQVTEGQIAYLGPETGGAVAIDLLDEVAFDGTARAWRLETGDQLVVIPEGAAGSEALLDALSPLPGLDAGHMVRALRDPAPGRRVVWTRRAFPALT